LEAVAALASVTCTVKLLVPRTVVVPLTLKPRGSGEVRA
jgi:hypothetical protein